jgi:hypothetical protein
MLQSGSKRKEEKYYVREPQRKLRKEELRNLYLSENIIIYEEDEMNGTDSTDEEKMLVFVFFLRQFREMLGYHHGSATNA